MQPKGQGRVLGFTINPVISTICFINCSKFYNFFAPNYNLNVPSHLNPRTDHLAFALCRSPGILNLPFTWTFYLQSCSPPIHSFYFSQSHFFTSANYTENLVNICWKNTKVHKRCTQKRIQTKRIFHISKEETSMRPSLPIANLIFSNVPMSDSIYV